MMTPATANTEVGSYPANMVLSPDGRYLVVTDTGFREQLSVLDTTSGTLVDKAEFNSIPGIGDKALYYGLAFDSTGRLYAANGPFDMVSLFQLGSGGKLQAVKETLTDASGNKDYPNFVAGLALSADRRTLFAAHNEAYRSGGLQSSLSVIDVASNTVRKKISLPGFPLALAAVAPTNSRNEKVYASCERDGVVASIDAQTGKVQPIKTGMQPTGLLLNKDQSRLYVSNSGSDTVSIIDTATDQVIKTILTRPAALRGLPGCTPEGLALSPDERTLFVALADLNAVGVIDLDRQELAGYIPAGWYPTAVAVANGNLFVANAKGVKAVTPNGKAVNAHGTYIQNIIEGTVSKIDLREAMSGLRDLTQQTLANNYATPALIASRTASFRNPGIKHVIYILKENRTYDQVLGDDPRGNGDPSLVLFGKEVTPNQHALADRFVLLDNFNVCAEVSGDGWQWSTAGIASENTSRNVPFNYSGRGRDYDFEGQTNGVAADFAGVPDVADAPGGYIWNACERAHVSFRNYGFYVDPIDPEDAKKVGLTTPDNGPTKKALLRDTDNSFRQFDTSYADSDMWVKYGFTEPKGAKTYGGSKAPSRYTEWRKEFDTMLAQHKVPQFMMVRFMRDHTAGTAEGLCTPQAMVADNDYAVGELVDAVSHSAIWKDTAIFIIEDDAQSGKDHVDCHRSTAYVISPYVKRSSVNSGFYNTDSVLRTMELLLGMKPMNEYDAVAQPLDVFEPTPVNLEPYRSVLPAREIAMGVNQRTAYRAADSARLISRYREASLPDLELNDILWHAIKGDEKARIAAPVTP
jgi:YVTN family beta-propeller protein